MCIRVSNRESAREVSYREAAEQRVQVQLRRRERVAERERGELAEARRRQKFAGFIEAVVEERYFGSEVKGAEIESNTCILVLRDGVKKLALHVETRGEIQASAVYALAKSGTRIRFPAGNVIQVEKWPPTIYGTFFEEKTWTGTKGADQIEFIEEGL